MSSSQRTQECQCTRMTCRQLKLSKATSRTLPWRQTMQAVVQHIEGISITERLERHILNSRRITCGRTRATFLKETAELEECLIRMAVQQVMVLSLKLVILRDSLMPTRKSVVHACLSLIVWLVATTLETGRPTQTRLCLQAEKYQHS